MHMDHLAVAGTDLGSAQAHVEAALGLPMQPGGQHATFGTHNMLLGLEEGLYLEAIAPDPALPAPARPRWFDLDRITGTPRLSNWICRTADLDTVLRDLPDGAGQPVTLARGDLRWRMAVPQTGILPFDNLFPALMQWDVAITPAEILRPSGVRLRRLTLRHPEGDALRAILLRHITDDRISIEVGPAQINAAFDTPHGPRSL